jgi:all-trans-retinol 13,14-reductase
MRIGYRYRPKRLAPEYDAIVIGSGMGGLTTAALLSELGWKVCVLEQHYTAGGYTHSYDRAGYEWDVGVHYIGDVGAKTRTRRMFDIYAAPCRGRWRLFDARHGAGFETMAAVCFGTVPEVENASLPLSKNLGCPE